jgi:hypothetical protein
VVIGYATHIKSIKKISSNVKGIDLCGLHFATFVSMKIAHGHFFLINILYTFDKMIKFYHKPYKSILVFFIKKVDQNNFINN